MGSARSMLNWFPVVLLAGIIIYCYYAYIVVYCTLFLLYTEPTHKTRGALFIAFSNSLLILLVWSFVQALITDAKSPKDIPGLALLPPTDVPEGPEPVRSEDGQKTLLPSSFASFCPICEYVKPDRTHHCRHCGKCILRFDHFCLWLNRCVGEGNYKPFILSLFYGVILALFVDITMAQQLIYDAANGFLFWNELQMLIAFVITFGFSMAVLGLLIFHLRLVSINQTTLEKLDAEGKGRTWYNPYDLGSAWANWKAVLGPRPWLWLLPIEDSTMEPGIWFPRQQPVP